MNLRVIGAIVSLVLAACGQQDVPDASHASAGDLGDGAVSRIFDTPYLMRSLDNGLRVIIVKTDYPDIVNLQILVQAGSRNEVEEGRSGFAHFFEHMMFRGTEKYPSAAYTQILKKAGANSNAYTTDDYTNYYTTFTKPDLEKIIELEADRFQRLDYSEPDFRTEALAVKGEYLKNHSNPLMAAFERARALQFSIHPYRHTTMGSIEDIEAMPDQVEYAKAFFDRWYRPEKVAVLIVGDVEPDATYDLVKKYWENWEAGKYTVDIPAEPAPEGPYYDHIVWEGETQPWLLIGFRSPAFVSGEKDMPAMSLLSSIYFSDSSALYQKLVIEDQTVDELATDFPLNKDPNLNLIYVRLTDEAHAADVEKAILATLAEARTTSVDVTKIDETKSRLRYSFASELDNSSNIGSALADYVQYDRTPETINAMYQAYDDLTGEDIRRIANEYFTDASRVTVSLSNSPGIAGLDSDLTLDELVSSAASVATSAGSSVNFAAKTDHFKEAEKFVAKSEMVPVAVVAIPLASSSLVDVSILVHAGAAQDPPGKKGLAALTASMLTDAGSATWSTQEINDAMYPIASGFDSSVDKEMTRLSGQVHRDNLDTWYRYVRSQLLNPGWNEQDFERIKTHQINAVRTGLAGDNDEELAKEVLYRDIYGANHPYGSLNLGNSGDIAAINLEDVKAFYASYYTVNNLTVGLSGGYPDSFATRIGRDLQVLPAGERTRVVLPAIDGIDSSAATIIEKETSGVAVSLGFPIDLKRGDPDWLALWLARSYLGEHRSENGRLYQSLRSDRGMNYGDYAYVEYFPGGMYNMRPGTNMGRQHQIFQIWVRPVRNNNDAHFATRAARFELEKLARDGMSESDFEATRTYLSSFASLMTDGQSQQLGYALDSLYYEIDEFPEYVREGLSKLTLADVNRVIRENLAAEHMQYVFVTKDGADLKQRLVADLPSPMRYESEKSAAIHLEDKLIQSFELDLDEDRIVVVPAEKVFH
ncbi:MAG: pitrilysin family protein [Proteobacteria bacterium]|nr:pitrilysin family protein [Pseudomonadota bacterium]